MHVDAVPNAPDRITISSKRSHWTWALFLYETALFLGLAFIGTWLFAWNQEAVVQQSQEEMILRHGVSFFPAFSFAAIHLLVAMAVWHRKPSTRWFVLFSLSAWLVYWLICSDWRIPIL